MRSELSESSRIYFLKHKVSDICCDDGDDFNRFDFYVIWISSITKQIEMCVQFINLRKRKNHISDITLTRSLTYTHARAQNHRFYTIEEFAIICPYNV